MQSLAHLQADILGGQITCEQHVQQCLAMIEKSAHLNIYLHIYREEALAQAADIDRRAKADPARLGTLFGLVCSLKDVICYADHPATAGSRILAGYQSPFSATVVERLLSEDAIIIGTVNCDEFAMGSSNENSAYGPTRNGSNPAYIPGGSSGASAVAVQMGTCQVSLGSDTGGSVRQPAAFCGVAGIKPTYGRLSRYGLIAYASSFDQIGIVGSALEDMALVLQTMAGADAHDSTCSTLAVPDYHAALAKPTSLRYAYLDQAVHFAGLQQEIRTSLDEVIEQMKPGIEAFEFDLLDYLVPAYYVLTMAEASSNLSRFDGVRYGHRSATAADFHEIYTRSRTEGFGTEVKRRIMLGTFVLSAGFYEAYFEKAQKIRTLVGQAFDQFFQEYDILLLPTTPGTAWEIGAKMDDPVSVYMSDVFTVIANLTGLPAISIPLGKDAQGLDFGLQLMADRFEEEKLFQAAKEINVLVADN